jgi:hypothetical protein
MRFHQIKFVIFVIILLYSEFLVKSVHQNRIKFYKLNENS